MAEMLRCGKGIRENLPRSPCAVRGLDSLGAAVG